MTSKKLRIIEFFLIGLVLGIAEDLLVVKSATGTRITLDVLFIASLIALPFAILSELVVDNPKFWKKIMKFLKIENDYQKD